jgi:integrase/recombinase XerC
LAARHAKNRKTKVQPIASELAALLRDYLTEKPEGQPVWGGRWAKNYCGAEMLRGDLETAGIPYVIPGPDGPLYADFHSLRHSYLTLGGRAGIDLRTLQELAGHSTPVLTARYSHRRCTTSPAQSRTCRASFRLTAREAPRLRRWPRRERTGRILVAHWLHTP